MSDSTITVENAFDVLASSLEESTPGTNPYLGMPFKDFFWDIFTLSYPDKDFDTWHVDLLIDDITRAFKEGKNYAAVLPRYHLKSTIGGYAVSTWRMATLKNGKVLYLSFKDGMARYHLAEIKRVIRENPKLSKLMRDLTARSLATCRYAVQGSGVAQVLSGGVLSFKRGTHVDGAVIVDDVLRDPQNPLNLSQLLVVERHIRAEIANIPNKGIPMLLFGTPMHAQDILLKLRKDSQFIWRFLPALRPSDDEELATVYGEHEVLWEQYDKKWLGEKAKSDWNSFQTEFLLVPAMEVAAFFTREELAPILSDIMNHSLYVPYSPSEGEMEETFAGYDVGKKRHPSHLAVLIPRKDGSLKMIHQSFHDHVDYGEQVRRMNSAVENFKIRRLLYDNTRAELEERGLVSECVPTVMSGRVRKEMATFFGKRVSEKTIELDSEVRFVSQIVCLSSDLQSPESPMGHGEAFWSVALAILAYEQVYGGGPIEIGNIFPAFNAPHTPGGLRSSRRVPRCPQCGGSGIVFRKNGANAWNPNDATGGYCLDCRLEFLLAKEVQNESVRTDGRSSQAAGETLGGALRRKNGVVGNSGSVASLFGQFIPR